MIYDKYKSLNSIASISVYSALTQYIPTFAMRMFQQPCAYGRVSRPAAGFLFLVASSSRLIVKAALKFLTAPRAWGIVRGR